MGSELPAIVTQPLTEPANDDWSLGPLREPEPQVVEARFKVVRKSDDDWARFLKRVEWVFTGLGSLIGAAAALTIAWKLGGH